MSTCISEAGEFSYHEFGNIDDVKDWACHRCEYNPYMFGDISEANDDTNHHITESTMEDDVAEIKSQVAEMHAIMKELGQQIGPAIAQIQSGGIMGMLMGRKK